MPTYSFIEPHFINFFENSIWHDDMHPSSFGSPLYSNGGPGTVLLGDRLVWKIYQAIRNSKSQKGNNWSNTLLIITFDEHGGCFDHVAPPAATSPDPADFNTGAGEEGFDFRRLGVRVPVVMVSAHIAPNTSREHQDGPLLVPENGPVQVEFEFAGPAPGHCHAFYRGVL